MLAFSRQVFVELSMVVACFFLGVYLLEFWSPVPFFRMPLPEQDPFVTM